jgi:hypothetical protein
VAEFGDNMERLLSLVLENDCSGIDTNTKEKMIYK